MRRETTDNDKQSSLHNASLTKKAAAFFFVRFVRFFSRSRLSYDTIISYGGFIVSIAVLTASLSLLFGYQKTLKEGLLGVNGHVFGYHSTRRYLTKDDVGNIENFLESREEVRAFSPVMMTQAMAAKLNGTGSNGSVPEKESSLEGVVLKSVNWQESNLPTAYHDLVIAGTSKLEKPTDVVIGERLADYLGAGLGDRLRVISPANVRYTVFGLKSGEMTVEIAGIYQSGIYETDSKTVFINQTSLSKLLGEDEERFNLIEIALQEKEIEQAHIFSREWTHNLRQYYRFDSWIDYNGNLFAMLVVQRWVIFIILSFIIVIASFGIASNTAKTLIERKKEVGIMRAIGADTLMIKSYFFGETIMLGLVSIVIGIFSGILISWLLTQQTLFMLQGDVYFIERFSTHISIPNLLLTITVSLAIALLASFVALKRISRLTVIEAISGV